MEQLSWEFIQRRIEACRRCETKSVVYLRVPSGEKRKPPLEPLRPVRLYFVSVAPPWGGAYFWDETKRDSVREGLFAALKEALGVPVTSCREFHEQRFFLTPAVKCPSEQDGNDHQPLRSAIQNCACFLRSELLAAEPERILALGRCPFRALCDIFGLVAPNKVADIHKQVWWVRVGSKEVPLSGTFFPGNNRHRGVESIIEDVARLLKLSPRS